MSFDTSRNLLGCFVAISIMFFAYRGGPVRYGTIPFPIEGRVILFICGFLIFVHFLRGAIILIFQTK